VLCPDAHRYASNVVNEPNTNANTTPNATLDLLQREDETPASQV
jgi:hypothetical protein